MKNVLNTLACAVIALLAVSCQNDFDNPVALDDHSAIKETTKPTETYTFVTNPQTGKSATIPYTSIEEKEGYYFFTTISYENVVSTLDKLGIPYENANVGCYQTQWGHRCLKIKTSDITVSNAIKPLPLDSNPVVKKTNKIINDKTVLVTNPQTGKSATISYTSIEKRVDNYIFTTTNYDSVVDTLDKLGIPHENAKPGHYLTIEGEKQIMIKTSDIIVNGIPIPRNA